MAITKGRDIGEHLAIFSAFSYYPRDIAVSPVRVISKMRLTES